MKVSFTIIIVLAKFLNDRNTKQKWVSQNFGLFQSSRDMTMPLSVSNRQIFCQRLKRGGFFGNVPSESSFHGKLKLREVVFGFCRKEN